MECKNCKKTIPDDSKFCVYCGGKVDSENEETKKERKENQEIPEIIFDIRNHLEFMGYELNDNQVEDKGVIRFTAINKNRPNLIISLIPNGNILLFESPFKIPKVDTDSKRHKLLEAANHINGVLALLSTLSVNTDFEGISFSSWYPFNYSKKEFSNFIEFFQNEINRLSAYEGLQQFI